MSMPKTVADTAMIRRKLPGGRVEAVFIDFREVDGRIQRHVDDARVFKKTEYESLLAARLESKEFKVRFERWLKQEADRVASIDAFRQKRFEYMRELKLVTTKDGKNTIPAFVNVADTVNLAIESIDIKSGTVSLYTQTEVNLQQLVELIRRSSNLTFQGEQELT